MEAATALDSGADNDNSSSEKNNDISIHPENSMLEEIPEKTEASEKEGDEES